MMASESIPLRCNPEASGVINGHGTMMVNGRQAWDMRELGNICHTDTCRLSRFSFGDVVPNVRQRVS